MKRKLLFSIILVLFFFPSSYSQYKDLEGVFFGKIISMGVGGTYRSYTDNLVGSSKAIVPFIYNVHFSNKKISTIKIALFI